MATRSEREKAFKLNEQHQNTLSKMLREEDNKYCADCEAKGTTFTLSVFLKLQLRGVHIITRNSLWLAELTGSSSSADISSPRAKLSS